MPEELTGILARATARWILDIIHAESSPSVAWQQKDECEVESLKNNMKKAIFKGNMY